MSAVNPYTPPRAAVSDTENSAAEFSDPKVWSVSGRLGRLRYLAYITVATLVMYLALVIAGVIGAASGSSGVTFGLIGLVYAPYIVLSIMLAIQRSHDMNWSGWTVLLAFIPFVGLIWVFKAGSAGANTYGNPPPPNTTAIKVLGLFIPILGGVVFIIGILAAVSLPAYQKYTQKAKAAQQQQQQAPQPQQQ